jgi:hypothetical protein
MHYPPEELALYIDRFRGLVSDARREISNGMEYGGDIDERWAFALGRIDRAIEVAEESAKAIQMRANHFRYMHERCNVAADLIGALIVLARPRKSR